MAAVVAYPVPQKRKASDAPGEGTSSSSSVTAKRARCDAKDEADTETIAADDLGTQPDNNDDEASLSGSRPPSVAATEISKAETTASGYRRPKKLRRHMAIHEKKEETRCQEPGCGKVFRKQETLQRHIKADHLGEKAYQCTHIETNEDGVSVECGKAFSKPELLRNHEAREHSGNRYFCDICPATEKPNDDLVDEMETLSKCHGYDEIRPIPCMIHGCPNRFTKDYELATHLELTHGWQVDDVNDRIAERRALEGGQFWLGGAEQIDAEYHEEEALREQLEVILRPGRRSELLQAAGAGDLMSADQGFPAGIEKQREQQPLAVNGMLGEDGEAMTLDPALMT
ncbi:hypothetical protein D0867_03436 [Hortaea werneckii]|uniref:C2H2-type domain-containing protein n=1 Tax=Hortaea werneckii TaxID=91943 RepID=A0A3M7A1D2_HORWE|nr:hypothetical protein D0867_03436 [Hortaea werneckii]